MYKAIDAHIHLDMYPEVRAREICEELVSNNVLGLVAVSRHLASCQATQRMRELYPDRVWAAYGFHPEQALPSDAELAHLLAWIRERKDEMVAIGEIGLPYYTRTEVEVDGRHFDEEPYVELLEQFIALAAELNKPVVLHAVYEDADVVIDLLHKHGVSKAHFHWFKGSVSTIRRMIEAGNFISITPDVCYEDEIRTLVREYPLTHIMVETDGPWPFEGPFEGQETHPRMVHAVIEQIALLKGLAVAETAAIVRGNTERFYGLNARDKD
ncbi:TatD family hydrolase [Paenibacillus ferrarius]|uniref:TatD family hydrolase n=1 Tax=Paenibacillus ferrarius TaxID=1469647 RepID=UPI003D26F27C